MFSVSRVQMLTCLVILSYCCGCSTKAPTTTPAPVNSSAQIVAPDMHNYVRNRRGMPRSTVQPVR